MEPTRESDTAREGSGEMFDGIAERYDLLNRILSGGVDERWRAALVDSVRAHARGTLLDLATGTADVALRLARSYPEARVLGVDPSRGMLARGEEKVRAAGLTGRITLQRGDAQSLELGDQSVSAATMAFGIRNVPDRGKALRELYRVLEPGGRVAILELSEPRSGLLGPLARFHIHRVVPTLGALLSGRREYHYLQRSIAAFPAPEAFGEQLREAGFEVEQVRPMTFGVVCLFVGRRPSRA